MSNPYELLGGEQGVRRLADEFYQVMAERAEATKIRQMHAENLSAIKDKLFMFLSGWMGGPDLYLQKYGTICLSSAHAAYAIGADERDQWLACMDQALINIDASEELREMLKGPMFQLADVMKNKD